MSVIVLEPIVFEAIAYQLKKQASPSGHEPALYPCCPNAGIPLLEKHVRYWMLLNELSFVAGNLHDGECMEDLYLLLQFKGVYPGVTEIQLYKWLTCIITNIDLHAIVSTRELTDGEKDSYLFLQTLIVEVTQSLLNSTPEYQAAEWHTFDNHSPLRVVTTKKQPKRSSRKHNDHYQHRLYAVVEITTYTRKNDKAAALQEFLLAPRVSVKNSPFMTITRVKMQSAFWK